MAGMLPGVECARRRRFHQSGGWSDSSSATSHGGTRRSSFCLYPSNRETHLAPSPSLQRETKQVDVDEKLGGLAREAKERLDERLRSQSKSEIRRHNSKKSKNIINGSSMVFGDLHTEVLGNKKKFNWAKLSWKAMEQEECTVCLERFSAGETLVHLTCAHRFHSTCLIPWLVNNAHCPCCRKVILLNHVN